MPALNFKKRYATAVEAGSKRQTIRARRKDGRDPKPGETLQLYTGMRSKYCRKLGTAKCVEVATIALGRDYLRVGFRLLASPAEREAFAVADGFGSFDELVDWFENDLGREFPWAGLVIYWGDLA